MASARLVLALAALLAAQAEAEAERLAQDFTCPAGDKRCTRGTSYIQRAQVVRKAAARSLEAAELELEAEELGQERRANASEGACCKPFGDWPNVDNGVTCGGCKALVLTKPYGGRCDLYCQSFGHVCAAAGEEFDEGCFAKASFACDQAITGTSDMLCTCRLPSAEPSCADAPAPKLPSGGRIEIRGRQVLVGGTAIHLKGVCWNPVAKAHRHADFRRYVEQDAAMMALAGINAVRTYASITDTRVLDALWAKGIYVVNSVYNSGGESPSRVASKVRAVKDHPAILMWTVGNEWNYNGLYMKWSKDKCIARVREVAQIIKSIDTAHPVASIYGEVPSADTINALPEIDAWGMNIYDGLSFHHSIEKFAGRSGKPLFMGEYGADAYNARSRHEDQEAQAHATKVLTEDLVAHSTLLGGVVTGGFLFEWGDEWWKDGRGSKSAHDVGGIAPGGGPYPDKTFNEEWWGIVDVDRKPRKAYHAYADVAAPMSTLESSE